MKTQLALMLCIGLVFGACKDKDDPQPAEPFQWAGQFDASCKGWAKANSDSVYFDTSTIVTITYVEDGGRYYYDIVNLFPFEPKLPYLRTGFWGDSVLVGAASFFGWGPCVPLVLRPNQKAQTLNADMKYNCSNTSGNYIVRMRKRR